jgi:beta-glucosidase
VPDADGPHTIGVVSTGPVTVAADAGDGMTTLVDDPNMELPRSEEFFGYGSDRGDRHHRVPRRRPGRDAVKWSTAAGNGFAAIRVGIRSPEPADLMDRAVAAAAAADVAVVMVGTNDEWETEGHDRTTMDLPGRQDELVRRVVAANPRTAVIVNAGIARDDGLGGRRRPGSGVCGPDVVLRRPGTGGGARRRVARRRRPGGRLPTTIPKRLADHPAHLHHRPDHDSTGAGTQRYGEGLFMGYRGYDARDLAPRFAFGHGLSYGAAEWGDATVVGGLDSPRRQCHGDRAGDGDRRPRCHRRGAGLRRAGGAVRSPPAEGAEGVVQAGGRRRFDRRRRRSSSAPTRSTDGTPPRTAWIVEPGEYDLVIAASATDERSRPPPHHRHLSRAPANRGWHPDRARAGDARRRRGVRRW